MNPSGNTRPRILLTCGDPAGIGPEIAVAAWSNAAVHSLARLRLVGDAGVMRAAAERLAGNGRGGQPWEITTVEPQDLRPSTPATLLVVRSECPSQPVPLGVVTAEGGQCAAAAVLAASQYARQGLADGIVTGPLNKAALAAAGYDAPGHTELLARDCGLADDAVSMMLWLPPGPGLRHSQGLGVVHVTLHVRLAEAVQQITSPHVVEAGLRLRAVLRQLIGREPRLAVAALNPHAGEGGLFGDEEQRIITPAVQKLVASGVDVVGPVPADTLFARAAAGSFDGIVAQYHDQGHIPVKLLGMHRAVNITLGLPIVRTSVAHGTAFDIVGTGTADPASMLSAIEAAVRLGVSGPGAKDATEVKVCRVNDGGTGG